MDYTWGRLSKSFSPMIGVITNMSLRGSVVGDASLNTNGGKNYYKNIMDKYAMEAEKLLKAIDVAIETNIKYPSGKYTQHIIDTLTEWKGRAMNPEKKYRKLASLKYLYQDIFNHYNTATGDKVDFFWKRIKEVGLDYHPIDIVDKVLKKKKITNRIEYEYINQNIVIAKQAGRITEAQEVLLNKWLGKYERMGYDS